MKVFVSQPMNGLTTEQIKKNRSDSLDYLRQIIDEHFEVIQTIYEDYAECKGKNTPLKFLARSIKDLSEADIAYFTKGWELARGCFVEHQAAIRYGIKAIYE